MNQFTETFTVNELAERVVQAGRGLGLNVAVRAIPNPRQEKERHYYNPAHSALIDLGLQPNYMTTEVLVEMLESGPGARGSNRRGADPAAGVVEPGCCGLRRWLVTGGCGFVGRNLIGRLVRDGGYDIVALDNQEVGSAAELDAAIAGDAAPEPTTTSSSVRVVTADILDPHAIEAVSLDRDVVVHLAANTGVVPSIDDPRADCMVNVVGTLNCLEAARHGAVTRFVFASSGAPLGEVEPPMHEEKAPRPCSPYGASKLAGEGYCSAYWHSYGLETVALRFGNVYGPHSSHKTSVIARFIQQALAGEPLVINGDGGQTRDFIYVGDLVQAIRQAANSAGDRGQSVPGRHRPGDHCPGVGERSGRGLARPRSLRRRSAARAGADR